MSRKNVVLIVLTAFILVPSMVYGEVVDTVVRDAVPVDVTSWIPVSGQFELVAKVPSVPDGDFADIPPDFVVVTPVNPEVDDVFVLRPNLTEVDFIDKAESVTRGVRWNAVKCPGLNGTAIKVRELKQRVVDFSGPIGSPLSSTIVSDAAVPPNVRIASAIGVAENTIYGITV